MDNIVDKALKEALKRNDERFAENRKLLNRTFLIIGIGICIYFYIQFNLIAVLYKMSL